MKRMKFLLLAGLAAISPGIGGAGAQGLSVSPSYTGMNGHAGDAARYGNTTAVTSSNATTANPMSGLPFFGVVPNPWDGSESWKQWYKDHPGTGGGNG